MRGLQGSGGAEADEGDTRASHLSVAHEVCGLAVCKGHIYLEPRGMQRLHLLQFASLLPEGIQDPYIPSVLIVPQSEAG